MKVRASILRWFCFMCLLVLAVAVANYWPRTLPVLSDGSVTHYRGEWWGRSYNKVVGVDRLGCSFEVQLDPNSNYSTIIGKYPDGTLREQALVHIWQHSEGCRIERDNVKDGEYYSADGKLIGKVVAGTGNVVYGRPEGTLYTEYILDQGKLTSERTWWKNGNLQAERSYQDGKLVNCSDYYPNGNIRSIAETGDDYALSEVKWFNSSGQPAPLADRFDGVGQF